MKFPEQFRVKYGAMATNPGDDFGAFRIPRNGIVLSIIASPGLPDGIPWEHVSVSTKYRCPTWDEMDFVKRLFWDDEQAVMQLHPPRSTWINNHEHCLHLWRPIATDIPLPPTIAVGI